MWDDDGMVSPRHQDDIAVLDGHGLVNIPRIGVDALKDKALRRIDAMIVGFFELTLDGDIVHVMFVRRIAGGVSAWSPASTTGRTPPAHPEAEYRRRSGYWHLCRDAAANGSRLDEPRRKFTLCRRGCHAKLGIGFCGHCSLARGGR